MPQMSGIDFIEKIREKDTHCKVKIMLRAYPKTPPLLYVIQAQTKCNIAI